jgi:hypothetical protein
MVLIRGLYRLGIGPFFNDNYALLKGMTMKWIPHRVRNDRINGGVSLRPKTLQNQKLNIKIINQDSKSFQGADGGNVSTGRRIYSRGMILQSENQAGA